MTPRCRRDSRHGAFGVNVVGVVVGVVSDNTLEQFLVILVQLSELLQILGSAPYGEFMTISQYTGCYFTDCR